MIDARKARANTLKPYNTNCRGVQVLLAVTICLVGWAGMQGQSDAAPVRPKATFQVTDCTREGNPGDQGTLAGAINMASSNDTIAFSCSGTIPITTTLTITKNLTLDGSEQTVILDGGGNTQVLSVPSSGVNLNLNSLTISHGSADKGGGLFDASGSTVNITNSTFSQNKASTSSGGIFNGGTLTITTSTIANNTSAIDAGIGNINGGNITIINSTIASNQATGAAGDIVNDTGAIMTIKNSTIANNSTTGAGSVTGGIYNAGSLTVLGNIVANNTAPANPTNPNCIRISGNTLTDNGYNLESASECGFTQSTDLQNTNPKLDLNGLRNNTGPTQTISLLDGSLAINKIPVGTNCPGTDQRGIHRPQGPTCDIGAFEFRLPVLSLPTSPVTMDATSPQGAIVNYSASASNPDPSPGTSIPTNCSPASGSQFPIGTTTVNCNPTNSAGSTPGSFKVVVNGAVTQVNELIALVNSSGFRRGIRISLNAQLQLARLEINAHLIQQAKTQLRIFIAEVRAYESAGLISPSRGALLIAKAQQIQAVLV